MAYHQNHQWGRGAYQDQQSYNQTQYPPTDRYGQPAPQAHRGPMTTAATFYPGSDEYMMPEQVAIVSPAPQRVMPEVPDQITDSLNNLEIQADSSSRRGPYGNMTSPRGYDGPSSSRPLSGHGAYAMPSMSPAEELAAFPQLINPGPNIPPTDEEKAAQIEEARQDVLSSNDPEMQLVWAQDALNYVEVTMTHLTRIRGGSKPQTPPLERTLKTDAMSVVNFLADQHHPRAEFMRGNWLEFGKFGSPTDKKEAFRCYARAAEKGFARAEYRMGMQFENSNEPMKAIRHYNRGSAEGDSASNYRLGMMTLLGQHGQTQDYARGVELIRNSAEYADENAPQGAYVYGLLLSRDLPGIDVPEAYLPMDIDLAREMIEKAAFLGFARAQLKMGSAYELCLLNCDFNPALSMHYNLLAARQGEAEAEMAISKWFLCGHEGVFDKNEELAYVYAKRAASTGLATAEFALGYFYEIGMFVPKDVNEAKYWYGKAASHGNKDASSRLEGISRSNTLSRQDHEKVAIAAIKSRHGSMRGKQNPRTARQSYQPPNIASIQEGPMSPVSGGFQMPDHGNDYNDYPSGTQYPGQVAPLNVNTNFIRTDGGQGPHSAVPPRTGSAAPYPLGNAMEGPVRPSTATGSGYGSHFRPRQNSTPTNPRLSVISLGGPGAIPPAGTYPPPANVPPRAGTTGPQGGFPRPAPGGYGAPQGLPSRPAPGRGQFGPGPGALSPPPHDPYGPPQQQRPPQDGPGLMGFEAPTKPPRSPGPGLQGGMGSPRPGTAASMHKPNSPLASPMSANFPRQGAANTPPRAHTPQPAAPVQSAPPAAQAAPAKPAAKGPVGKGPKTFEEMGVPVQKEDQDCTIM